MTRMQKNAAHTRRAGIAGRRALAPILRLAFGLAVGIELHPAAAGAIDTEPAGALTGKAAFEMLRELAGTCEGTAGDGADRFPARVDYRVASNGTVVMETLFPGTEHEMISMYSLDRGDLVMTHYCAAGNQPRMRLDTARSTPGHLVLAFDGGTNFDPKKDGHIHSGEIELRSDGALHAEWTWFDRGKDQGAKKLDLSRKP